MLERSRIMFAMDNSPTSKKKRPRDPNQLAAQIVAEAVGDSMPEEPDTSKNPAAVALGRLGGKKGGPARASKLTPDERKEIAMRAAKARWKTEK